MKPTAALLVALGLLVAGCGASSGVAPGKAVPKVGDKHIVGDDEMSDVWSRLEAMRLQRRKLEDGTWKQGDSETDDADRSRVGLVTPGDLVEVLEVGDDYAAVDVIRRGSGEPGRIHGYVWPWWKPVYIPGLSPRPAGR